jgi:hypothetical protein
MKESKTRQSKAKQGKPPRRNYGDCRAASTPIQFSVSGQECDFAM